MASHVGIVATIFARYPKIIDFSCGFQSYLPSGTCSSARRERSTSRSSSAKNNSVSFIASPLHALLLDDRQRGRRHDELDEFLGGSTLRRGWAYASHHHHVALHVCWECPEQLDSA